MLNIDKKRVRNTMLSLYPFNIPHTLVAVWSLAPRGRYHQWRPQFGYPVAYQTWRIPPRSAGLTHEWETGWGHMDPGLHPLYWKHKIACFKCLLQSGVVITRFDILWFPVLFYSNGCRTWISVCIHKRHPISRPHGRAMACLLWVSWIKLTVL